MSPEMRLNQLQEQVNRYNRAIADDQARQKLLTEQRDAVLAQMRNEGIAGPIELVGEIERLQVEINTELDQIQSLLANVRLSFDSFCN